MNNLIDEILIDLNWRSSQLGKLKVFKLQYKLTPQDSDFILRFSTPIIYSIWEGFVSNSFSLYTREINKLNLTTNNICKHLLTYAVDSKLNLTQVRLNFGKKIKFVSQLENFLSDNIRITNKLPTNSNINFNTINEILEIFRLNPLPEDEFKYDLNKLLNIRNQIAHGESNVIVKEDDISQFTILVNTLMNEIVLRLEDAINNELYKDS